jgi:hypothetical protein
LLTPVSPAFQRLRQEDLELEVSLGYTGRLDCLKEKQNTKQSKITIFRLGYAFVFDKNLEFRTKE